MTTYFNNPNITDITQIAATMAPLRSLSMFLAMILVGLLLPLEVIHQNMNAVEGKNNYTGMFVRTVLVFIGLILYDRIFDFVTQASKMMELAVLNEEKWAALLGQLSQFFQTKKVTITTSLPLVFTWIASFLALLAERILYWVRYCLLSVLYFVGPVVFTFNIFQPISFLPKSWFKNVIQLSLWTVVMKVIVCVMLQLEVMTYMTGANASLDVMTIIGINVTFVIMIIFSPHLTASFINGQAIGPLAAMTSTLIASKTFLATKAFSQKAAGMAAAPAARAAKKIATATKTALRNSIFKEKYRFPPY